MTKPDFAPDFIEQNNLSNKESTNTKTNLIT